MAWKTFIAVAISALSCVRQTSAFSPPTFTKVRHVPGSSSALHLNVPRLTLPDVVTTKLDDFGLKNPNDMSTEEYNGYSGAAIGGTLIFLLLPGALLTGLFENLGDLILSVVTDFAFSATVGGGAAIYLSLRDDEIGETVRENGLTLYSKIKESGLPVVPRQQVPDVVTEKLVDIGLLDVNKMSEDEYDGYSGAAVAGTLLFFLLPGLLLSGLVDVAGDALPSLIVDFLLSAVVGGGAAIYLSLRKDEIGDTVSNAGASLVSAVGNIVDSD